MKHSGVDFEVGPVRGNSPADKVFHTFRDAAAHAVSLAASGLDMRIDVLCFTRAGAKHMGLEESYDEDPEASVTERIIVKVDVVGRVA